jgi:hypothetical protein
LRTCGSFSALRFLSLKKEKDYSVVGSQRQVDFLSEYSLHGKLFRCQYKIFSVKVSEKQLSAANVSACGHMQNKRNMTNVLRIPPRNSLPRENGTRETGCNSISIGYCRPVNSEPNCNALNNMDTSTTIRDSTVH